ncbi:MAG: large conductance mechanosensitive channel protein MscL [Acidobacteria bacterium]|nr:MAG: large conductance mechanosensitive channel protein MscL [Acidobacteriota bacterium]REK02827.1 MAG: large conductance mechanosensitive channel protein MscL [Acidobacteriota bacterium]REK13369.1 MAG: large conductance mechanosensitive channel protein MscL [Acidobacteriota bacterium]REK41363.1 MAG: large conductance mechanosensitive channel protein MscL [Acidobacteriota bacterium]
MWNDFKEFLKRGNVIDLAIAVVIGAAFGKVITSLVEGVIMPPIGFLTGGIDFKAMFYDVSGKYNGVTDPAMIDEAIKGGAPLIMYGQLITDIIQFLIVAFVIFIIARYTVRYFKFLEAEKGTPPEVELLTEIRDLLKAKS